MWKQDLCVVLEEEEGEWVVVQMGLEGEDVLVVHPLGLSRAHKSRTASSASPVVHHKGWKRRTTHEPAEDVLDLDPEFGHLQIEREVVVVRS